MNISTNRFRSHLVAAAAMLSVAASVMGTSASTALAAKPVPAPTSIQIILLRPDSIQLNLLPAAASADVQLISGPNTAGSPIGATFKNNVGFSGLVADSDYVFRARNVQTRTPSVVSAWVNFSFHTPAQFASRPNPPKNLHVAQTTATQVIVMWDAPDASAYSYAYSVDGGRPIGTYGNCAPYCADVELRTAYVTRPAPGTSVTLSVTATDNNANTSLPATLVITG